MPNRVCVLHVGTHKTGTTALQYFLQANVEALRAVGVLFSGTGWYGVVPGNHHVAWDAVAGTFDRHVADLARELRESGANAAVVSAEDLSLLPSRPDNLERFVTIIREAGYQPKILIYLRDQAGFIESMYAERVKHGDVRPFAEYLLEAIDRGSYTKSDPPILFDYAELVGAFEGAVGTGNVLVRPYARSSDDLAIFHDFLTSLERLIPDFRVAGLKLDLHHPRINESLTFGALLGQSFIALRPDVGLPSDANAFFERWAPEVPAALLNARFSLLRHEDKLRIFERFKTSNDRVSQQFNVALPIAPPSTTDAASNIATL